MLEFIYVVMLLITLLGTFFLGQFYISEREKLEDDDNFLWYVRMCLCCVISWAIILLNNPFQ